MTSSPPPRPASRGFTLLEVLVVLIVVSLISVVLMQGLSLVLGLRESFGGQLESMDRALMNRNLVHQPLRGLVPDFNDGEHVFSGATSRVTGLTLQPLSRRGGRPTPVALELDYDPARRVNTLIYREMQDDPIELLSWEGDEAAFRFIGDETGWQDAWPPQQAVIMPSNVITEVGPPQLPELIFLDTNSQLEPDFAVTLYARRNRVPRDPVFGTAEQ